MWKNAPVLKWPTSCWVKSLNAIISYLMTVMVMSHLMNVKAAVLTVKTLVSGLVCVHFSKIQNRSEEGLELNGFKKKCSGVNLVTFLPENMDDNSSSQAVTHAHMSIWWKAASTKQVYSCWESPSSQTNQKMVAYAGWIIPGVDKLLLAIICKPILRQSFFVILAGVYIPHSLMPCMHSCCSLNKSHSWMMTTLTLLSLFWMISTTQTRNSEI